MAVLSVIRVMVLSCTTLLLLPCLTSLAVSSLCPEKQFLNAKLQLCMNCSNCTNGTVVLRPCEFHRDTHCAPMSELLKTMESRNPHRHKHAKQHHQKQHREPSEDLIWRFGDDVEGGNQGKHAVAAAAFDVASSEAPFSSTETLVWDWQAVALTSAVFACILFFLVITLYSLHQAKQWRRLKDNFEADVEELSARLSLMAASSTDNCEFLKSTEIGSITDENYLNSKCVYLEQLLSVRKDGDKIRTLPKGNVYIEEKKSKT